MIRVLVKKNTERILRIELRGHADYAEKAKILFVPEYPLVS